MNLARQKRNERRLGHERKPLCAERGELGRALAERKKHTFTRTCRLHCGGKHGMRGLAEIAVGRKFRPQIGQGFNSA